MKRAKKKLKKLPVWFIAALLVIGAVGAAGMWLFSPDIPARYDEPFLIEYSDELNREEWIKVSEFPLTIEKEPIDLTYRTFHDYIRITNEGRRKVNVTADFEPLIGGGIEKDDVGFVLLQGVIDAENLRWENDTIEEGDQREKVRWGSYDKEITLGSDETKVFTLVNVLNPKEAIDSDDFDLNIRWEFSRKDPSPDPVFGEMEEWPRTDLEAPGPDLYNFTPLALLISVLGTAVVGYTLYRKLIKKEG